MGLGIRVCGGTECLKARASREPIAAMLQRPPKLPGGQPPANLPGGQPLPNLPGASFRQLFQDRVHVIAGLGNIRDSSGLTCSLSQAWASS